MDSAARRDVRAGGARLHLEYYYDPSTAAAAAAADPTAGLSRGAPPLDWLCAMCSSVNFARRIECYHCSSARTADAKRVAPEPEGPSTILKVSGIEPQTRCGGWVGV